MISKYEQSDWLFTFLVMLSQHTQDLEQSVPRPVSIVEKVWSRDETNHSTNHRGDCKQVLHGTMNIIRPSTYLHHMTSIADLDTLSVVKINPLKLMHGFLPYCCVFM